MSVDYKNEYVPFEISDEFESRVFMETVEKLQRDYENEVKKLVKKLTEKEAEKEELRKRLRRAERAYLFLSFALMLTPFISWFIHNFHKL